MEVDKFFYSRKAEKVTVPSLEGEKKKKGKEKEKEERGEERPTKTGPTNHDGNSNSFPLERVKYFIYFCPILFFFSLNLYYVSSYDDFRMTID